MGFPIRKSSDQSSFAAPRSLSQRTTSFIASQRQGIHQMPFRHLIALIIDTHPSAEVLRFVRSLARNEMGIDSFGFSLEKTSLLHKPSIDVSVARACAGRQMREKTCRKARV